jgi:hypothetical protein
MGFGFATATGGQGSLAMSRVHSRPRVAGGCGSFLGIGCGKRWIGFGKTTRRAARPRHLASDHSLLAQIWCTDQPQAQPVLGMRARASLACPTLGS